MGEWVQAPVAVRRSLGLAHQALRAGIATGADLSTCVLWSTHRPCGMCAAASSFTGVGEVRFLAPDPSDVESSDPDDVDDRWAVLANVLFLEGISRYSGPHTPMIGRAGSREPETVALLPSIGPVLFASSDLALAVAGSWPAIEAAALARADRRRRGASSSDVGSR